MKLKSTILNHFSFIRNIAILAACIGGVAATTSCGTTRGFGQDVEKTGDKIQEAATR